MKSSIRYGGTILLRDKVNKKSPKKKKLLKPYIKCMAFEVVKIYMSNHLKSCKCRNTLAVMLN